MSFCIEGGHALLLKNPRVFLHTQPPKRKLRQGPRPNAVEFVPYEGLAEGTYQFENSDYLRREFLNQGLCPRITVSSPHCLKSFTIEKCKMPKEPEHGPEIRAWLSNLRSPWYGEALPAASLRGLTSSLEIAKGEAQRRRENKNIHGTGKQMSGLFLQAEQARVSSCDPFGFECRQTGFRGSLQHLPSDVHL